jgi:hypothetical protein
MTVHYVGARPPAGFQDANYFAQRGDAAQEHASLQLPARFICTPTKRRLRETVSLLTSLFRALTRKMSRLTDYRRVPADVPGRSRYSQKTRLKTAPSPIDARGQTSPSVVPAKVRESVTPTSLPSSR